ncbi:hypothetical protein Cgig2_010443 [Carnegiea gigantea]|uniref:Sm domain-containing protein n=1 Tax=Carnegiea gigantea TaxID=171969 RepID=A0A9Q1GUM1_9CARY|nr:hypothetical protein Cgig2_010443 [Carnegiea gigantea]
MSTGGEKASANTKTPADFLKSIRGRPVVVKLNSGVDYRGILACLDGYMNIAMEQTEEYVNGQLKNKYGDAFIRGNNGLANQMKSTLETFKWWKRDNIYPPPLPHPSSEDYQMLYPGFVKEDLEEAAWHFQILGIVQASSSSFPPLKEARLCRFDNGRVFIIKEQASKCDKFLKWAANEGPQERPVVVDVDIVKKEFMEMRLMLKFIEKGSDVPADMPVVQSVFLGLPTGLVLVFLFFLYFSNSRPLLSLGLPQVKLLKTMEHNNPVTALSSSKYILHYVQEQCLLALMRAVGRKEKEKHLLTRHMQFNHINRDDKTPY